MTTGTNDQAASILDSKEISMLKKALLYTALATTLAGAATMVTAAPRSV
ncbi:MAG: hypothetical protein INH06_30210, partial [Cupriavidus sp.]|nr:hypothetical protein [Cupriavidus sp.]